MSESDSDSRSYFMKMKYQERQFLRARDFQDEQNYHIEKAKNHNNTLHTRGICKGMKVTLSDKKNCVNVSAGTAIDASGNTIYLAKDETVDLSKFFSQIEKNGEIFLTVRYGEADPDTQYKQDEGGFKGFTRTLEKPDFEPWSAANTDPDRLLLAVIERKDGKIVSCDDDPDGRLVAGVQYADVMQTGNLANQSVTTAKIQDGAVTSEKLEQKSGSNLVTLDIQRPDKAEDKAGTGDMVADNIKDSVVSTANLQGLDLTEEKAGLAGRAADRIKDGFVTTANLQGLDLTEVKAGLAGRAADNIKDSVVTTVNLQGLDMTEEKERPGVVNAGAIQAGALNVGALQTGTLFTGNLERPVTSGTKKGAVATANIQDGAVTSAELEKLDTAAKTKGAVATANIQDGAVTSAKIGTGAVAEAKIGTGAVTEAKIGTGAVTSDKLEKKATGKPGAVATLNIQDGAVTADKIKDGSLPLKKLNYYKFGPFDFSIKMGNDDASSKRTVVYCVRSNDYMCNYPYSVNIWATGTDRGETIPHVTWYQYMRPNSASDSTEVSLGFVAQVNNLAVGETMYGKYVIFIVDV